MTKVDIDGFDWVHMPGASETVGSIVTLGLETGFTKHFFSDFVIEDNGHWLDQLGRETDLDDRLSFFQSEEKLLGLCKRVAKAYNSIKNSRAVFVDHFNLAQAAFEMVENFQINRSQQTFPISIDNYKYKYAADLKSFPALAPVLHFAFAPWPWELGSEDLKQNCMSVLAGDDPLTAVEICQSLYELGVDVNEEFLPYFLINDPSFLSVFSEGILRFDLAEEIFTEWHLASEVLEPLDYINFGDVTGFSSTTYNKTNLNPRPKRVMEFFNFHSDTRFIHEVSWLEVLVKLRHAHNTPKRRMQSMTPSLHKKLSQALKGHGKVIMAEQLNQLVGADVSLRARDIGPGEIMVWHRGAANFRQNIFGLVHENFVSEGDYQQRGKIHKKRIANINAFSPRMIDEDAVFNITSSLAVYLNHKVFHEDQVVSKLTRQLAINSNDFHRIESTLALVRKILNSNFIDLGKGLFADKSHHFLSRYERLPRRRAALLQALASPISVPNYISKLPEEEAAIIEKLAG